MRKILPWNICSGMQAAFGSRTSTEYINRYRILTVVNVTKYKAVMCSGYTWRVEFDNGETWRYYGKTGRLAPQTLEVL